MNVNVNLQPNDILKKEFKSKKLGGYDPTEVDEYLDDIIQDYDVMLNYIKQLEAENESLRKEILDSPTTEADEEMLEEFKKNASTDDVATEQEPETVEEPSISQKPLSAEPELDSMPMTTNYDILRRLSNLEKKVFGEELK